MKFTDHWALHGKYNSPEAIQQIIGTLQEHILALPYTRRWCIFNIQECSDEGRYLSKCIQQKTAIAVSDGSFKDDKGSVAWVLEDSTSLYHLSGHADSPGSPVEQSAYRSELVGLLELVMLIQELSMFHNISEGQVTVGCDNESALNLALTWTPKLHPQWPTMTSSAQ